MRKTNKNLRGVPTRLAALFMCVLCLTTVIPLSAAADEGTSASSQSVTLLDEQSANEESEATSEVSETGEVSEASETSEVSETSETSEASEVSEASEAGEVSDADESSESSEASGETREPITDPVELYYIMMNIRTLDEMEAFIDTMTDEELDLVDELETVDLSKHMWLMSHLYELGYYVDNNFTVGTTYDLTLKKGTEYIINTYFNRMIDLYYQCSPVCEGITVEFYSGYTSYGYDVKVDSSVPAGNYTLQVIYSSSTSGKREFTSDTINLTVTEGEANVYNYTVEQNSEQIVTKDSKATNIEYTCSADVDISAETSRVYLYERGYTIKTGKTVPVGDYVLTVNYTLDDTQYTDIVNLTVTEVTPEKASIYYLKTPTANPNSNSTTEWCDSPIGIGGVFTSGATWVGKKNIFNPSQYIRTMADGMTQQSDGSWLLDKGTYRNAYQEIFNAYKEDLKSQGITVESADDIEAIYLNPYKISQDNGTEPDMHIDCTISVRIKNVYVAKYWVTWIDGSEYQVDAKSYEYNEDGSPKYIYKTDVAPTNIPNDEEGFPKTYEVNGVTYVFKGWYNENGDHVSEELWEMGYDPDADELADGTVNFYAHYEAKTMRNLTITKELSGDGYNDNDTFTFYLTYDEGVVELDPVVLGNGESHTFQIPEGAVLYVSESKSNYTMKVDTSLLEDYHYVDPKTFNFKMPANDLSITITNERDIPIDTGISLETVPYVLIIVFVGAGIGFYFVRRRRHLDR